MGRDTSGVVGIRKQRLLLGLVMLLLAEAAPRRALAEGVALSVGDTGATTCVTAPDLADALRRSGLVVDSASSTRVDVSGEPAALVVSIHGAVSVEEHLAPAACNTATDVVAAFVVSALAPPPVVELPAPPPSPPPSSATVKAALRDAVRRQRTAISADGAELTIVEKPEGWEARIFDRYAPACTETVRLGNFADVTQERTRAAAAIIERARERQALCAVDWRSSRVSHLADALETVHDRLTWRMGVDSWLLALEGGLFLAFDTLLPSNTDMSDNRERALKISAHGIWLAGGTASIIAPADYKQGIVGTSFFAGLGTLWLASLSDVPYGSPLPFNSTRADDPTYPRYSLAAASFATAGLITLRAALGPPPLRRIERAYRATRSESQQSRFSSKQIHQAELDLYALEPKIPDWVVYAPVIVGGAVATVPAFADGFDSARKNDMAIWGAVYMFFGAIGAIPFHPYRDYRRELKKAGFSDVSVGGGPGDRAGLSISGRF